MAVTYESTYKGNSILTDKEKGYGCKTEILDAMRSVIDSSVQKHNKVLCVRFDLRFPSGTSASEKNKNIQDFASKYKKHFKRQGYDPQYLWVREQSREKRQHYHLMVTVNGNKIQYPNRLLSKAEDLWKSTIGSEQDGLVDHCNRSRKGENQPNSYMLRRNAPDFDQVYDRCHKRCSYLTKENTKGYAPKGHREFGYSRIPKSNN
ncbi:inovirus-type Gp2 protein [Desulfovibrio sp. JC022]|uniref:YagK/YfjJ domain-containing protein n=1 Tax=Desulfovibrio sp. JC022 TaxID=2593642 RepID=UPI0013CFF6EB|nr:inovirus-type Gp2 protein [Desulfovibrio sp. JC022]